MKLHSSNDKWREGRRDHPFQENDQKGRKKEFSHSKNRLS